jgi:2OG-Fe(II) oxygenase superfamily
MRRLVNEPRRAVCRSRRRQRRPGVAPSGVPVMYVRTAEPPRSLTSNFTPTGVGLRSDIFQLPEATSVAFPQLPCVRIPSALTSAAAEAIHSELRSGIKYERVELADVTRQWRALRPTGDVYFGPMQRHPGWSTPPLASAALAGFDSRDFIEWLSILAGEQLTFRRPVTAYRMDRGDRLCLHDDMSDPDHAISVAYNCSTDWDPAWGGGTRFGEVTSVTPLPTPPDSPIELREWRITNEQVFSPQFNSLLVMRLDPKYAHGVTEVTGPGSRYAIVGIYARSPFA